MDRRQLLALALILLGILGLLARTTAGSGWLWLGVVAAVAIAAYANTRTYGFLLLGGVMAGSALGLLLSELARGDGVFLISLGAGFVAVDRIEPRGNRWVRSLGLVLAVLGLLVWLVDVGGLGTAWLPLLLIALGVALLWRDRRRALTFPPPLRPVETPRHTAPSETATPPTLPDEPSR